MIKGIRQQGAAGCSALQLILIGNINWYIAADFPDHLPAGAARRSSIFGSYGQGFKTGMTLGQGAK